MTHDLRQGELLKEEGMQTAADNRALTLKLARDYAYQVALRKGYVTADDVSRAGYELGPAAGSLFRDGRFEFTGEWRKSAKVSNHARYLRVWKLR